MISDQIKLKFSEIPTKLSLIIIIYIHILEKIISDRIKLEFF